MACAKKDGCNDRKGVMLKTVADWLERLYPTRCWGELNDELAVSAGVLPQQVRQLAQEIADRLGAQTVFRPGADADLCDYIYVLCVGRKPCILQRLDEPNIEGEWYPTDTVNEVYLRVACSNVAPLAVVQETSVHLSRVADDWIVREHTRAGVYEGNLLRRFRRLVTVLEEHGLTHVDHGEVATPPNGYNHDAYVREFHVEPDQVNYLFYQQPSVLTTTSVLR